MINVYLFKSLKRASYVNIETNNIKYLRVELITYFFLLKFIHKLHTFYVPFAITCVSNIEKYITKQKTTLMNGPARFKNNRPYPISTRWHLCKAIQIIVDTGMDGAEKAGKTVRLSTTRCDTYLHWTILNHVLAVKSVPD